MKKEEKTNVMRVLEGKKTPYISHSYEPDASMSGEEIAQILGEEAGKVFKTLVTRGKSGAYYVFVITSSESIRRKGSQHDQAEGAASADRVCTRWLFSDRHEEAFPDLYP